MISTALIAAMFTLSAKPTFTATVHISVPGQPEPVPLEFIFNHMGRKAHRGWLGRSAQVAAITDDDERARADAAWLAEAIHGWTPAGGPRLPNGDPAPYSQQALEQLLDAYPNAGTEILAAYQAELLQAKQKNS